MEKNDLDKADKGFFHYLLIVLGFIFMVLCIIMLIGTLYAGWVLENT